MITSSAQIQKPSKNANKKQNKHGPLQKIEVESDAMGSEHPLLTGHTRCVFFCRNRGKKPEESEDNSVINYGPTISMKNVSYHIILQHRNILSITFLFENYLIYNILWYRDIVLYKGNVRLGLFSPLSSSISADEFQCLKLSL